MLIRNFNRRVLPKQINHRDTISLDRRFLLGDACLSPVHLWCLYLAYLRMLFGRFAFHWPMRADLCFGLVIIGPMQGHGPARDFR